MHIGEFVRGKGKFLVTEYVPTAEKVNARSPDPDHRAHPEPDNVGPRPAHGEQSVAR